MSAPLEVGAVVRRVFAIYVERASILFPTAAVVFVIGGLVGEIVASDAPRTVAFVVFGLQVLAFWIYTGMLVKLVADVRDGRSDTTTRQLLEAVRPVLAELILVSLVGTAGELVGAYLLLVPGLILLTLWSVATPVVVAEHPGGLRALGRSQQLVHGYGWPVFGVIVAFGLILLAGGVVAVLASIAGLSAGLVTEAVISVLVLPLISLASVVLYFELRERQPAATA